MSAGYSIEAHECNSEYRITYYTNDYKELKVVEDAIRKVMDERAINIVKGGGIDEDRE